MADEKKSGGMKSALEIAMERTRDIEPGEDPFQLTPEQKQAVKQINSEFDAEIAKLELDFSQRLRGMIEQYGEEEVSAHLESFQNELRNERNRINAERQAKVQAYTDSLKDRQG